LEGTTYLEELSYLDLRTGDEFWAEELPGYAYQTVKLEDIQLVLCDNRFPVYTSGDDQRENPIWQFIVALDARDGTLLARWEPTRGETQAMFDSVRLMWCFGGLYAVTDRSFGLLDARAIKAKADGWH
jgi:hypothetical protein